MLYQELPPIESTPLDGWGRWLAPALVAGAALSAGLLLFLIGQGAVAGGVIVAGFVAALVVMFRRPAGHARPEPLVVGPEYELLGSALGLSADPVALTTGEGSLLLVNAAYRERFGGARVPLDLAASDEAREGLELAQGMAWRDGAGCVAGIETIAGTTPVEVERVGTGEDLLLWRFAKPAAPDPISLEAKRLRGRAGDLLSRAGVLAAFVDPQGTVIACNRLFEERALGGQSGKDLPRLTDLVAETEHQGDHH